MKTKEEKEQAKEEKERAKKEKKEKSKGKGKSEPTPPPEPTPDPAESQPDQEQHDQDQGQEQHDTQDAGHEENIAALVAEFHSDDNESEMQTAGIHAVETAIASAQVVAFETHTYRFCPLRCDEDVSKYLAVYGGTGSGLGRLIAKAIARNGNTSSWLIWVLVMIISINQPGLREQLCNLYVGVLLSCVMVMFLRSTVGREKPHFSIDGHSSGAAPGSLEHYSFPSGSASLSAMAACFVVVQYNFEPTVVYVACAWVFIAGLITVLLGRHYVLDIVGGWLLGIAIFLFLRRFLWLRSDQCERFVKPIRDRMHL